VGFLREDYQRLDQGNLFPYWQILRVGCCQRVSPLIFKFDCSVGNITFVNFFAKLFAIPLKDTENPKGLITDQELFLILGAIFTYLFFNADESSGLKLQINTFDAYKQAAELLKVNVTKVKLAGGLDKAIDDIKDPKGFLHLYGDNLIRRMLKDGNSIDDIVAQALLTSTGVINISPQVPLSDSEIRLIIVCANDRHVSFG
jgi:hypothetical protein